MGKIIRDSRRVSKYKLDEFSHVERGEKLYKIQSFSFDEERSIQDSLDELDIALPNTINTVDEDDITDDIYLPPSKLAKASDNIKMDKVVFSSLRNDNDTFNESPLFSDAKAAEDEYPKKVISSADQPQETSQISDNNATTRVKVLEELLIQKEEEFNKIKTEQEENYLKLIDETKKSAYDEGYNKARSDISSEYEAKRDDYIKSVEKINDEALKKLTDIDLTIKNIDEHIPKLVLGYVQSIIGTERKINDDFILNLIRKNIKKVEELRVIEFKANPDDVDLLQSKFPNYKVSADTNLIKGAINIITESGVISLNVDNMIIEFGKSINEEFRVS